MKKEMIKVTDKLQDEVQTYKKGESAKVRHGVFIAKCFEYRRTLKDKQDLKDFDAWYKNMLTELEIYQK